MTDILFKFLDPKNDVAFKRIFGTEKNKDILIHFINDILGFSGPDKVQDIEFLKTIFDPEIAYKKQSVLDILCKSESGTQFIVEMQVAKTIGFEQRAQFYAARAYSQALQAGEKYHKLKPVIFIAIADCIIFPDEDDYQSSHAILNTKTYKNSLKGFYFTFIELPKFPKIKENQLDNIADKWIYFFKYANKTSEEELEKIIGSDIIIKKAYDQLNKFFWSNDEMRAYDQEIKNILDEQAMLDQKMEDGIKKGREEGIQIGKLQGKMELAKMMLANNIDIHTVAKVTGLSVDKIRGFVEV